MPSATPQTRAAAALVALIVASLMGFALAVVALRDQTNRRAAVESVEGVATGLRGLQGELATLTRDFNMWDAAYEAMLAGDTAWIYENYAYSAVEGAVMDGVVLLGAPFPEPLAWTAAAPSEEPAAPHLPPDLLARMTREVQAQPVGAHVTFDALTVIDGQLVLLSAMRTQPQAAPDLARDPADYPIAVFTDALAPEDFAALGESRLVSNLSWGPQPGLGLPSLPVAGPDGERLGFLSWEPPRPGSEVVATMAPLLLAAGLAFAALGGIAAWLVRAHARHLTWEGDVARRLARTDGLTGLANRLAFGEHLARLTADAPPQVAVLFLDLNGFKCVNDRLGHAAGDALVAGVALRLARLAEGGAKAGLGTNLDAGRGGGPGDTFLARLGGDEFAFVLAGPGGVPGGVAAAAAELSRAVSAALAEPFVVVGEEVRVSASQGLALRDAPDVSLDELVRRADMAMYRAKRERAGAVRSYSPELDSQAPVALVDAQGALPGTLRVARVN